ncbi:MAG TPA: transglutaminaseTgpA domain-containing protein [Planctomycetota bacterium]|nr:transglutaminaseTgpA domain-containing protein [Planctomycetota bacterium]
MFPLLFVLTLLDLGFVEATAVVSGSELVPLWLLAAASPWLRRLQRYWLYRCFWNLGVLVVFALLVRHATTTGLLHMLEDGLLLAVLCQVHLLNNIGERQRPDLIFFNSFLVAFVTSFFAADLVWSLLFVAHSFVLVPTLQVYALARREPQLARDLLRAVLRDSVPRTVAVGCVTALVFVVWPRDFHRDGWLGEAMALGRDFEAGLAEQIRIDHEQPTLLSDALVMQIRPASGRAEQVPSHWRATAFSIFDGATWLPQDSGSFGSRLSTDDPWRGRRDGSWQRTAAPAGGVLQVRLHDLDTKRLLCPLQSTVIRLGNGEGLLLDAKSYGVLAFLRLEDAPLSWIDYTVALGGPPAPVPPSPGARAHLLSLPGNGLPGVVQDLAARLRAQLPADADAERIARASCDWLREHRRYQLPGGPGFARNIGEFLLGSGAGHCEYFATALALLLRLQDVPCRLVGGYLAHEWDAQSGALVVRARDAHAWVEAMLPDGVWITLDATPPSDVFGNRRDESSWWGSVRTNLESLWSDVVMFDGKKRLRWLQALGDLPEALAARPFGVLMGLGGAIGVLCLWRRRRQSLPAIVELQRAVRATGLALQRGETPRELLARAAAAADVDPRRLQGLREAAQRHEARRYAPPAARP